MYTVTKEIYFCYGHRLLHYAGQCRHLHGHNGRVEVELQSEVLDSRGMVYDFSDISRVIKTWISETLDHTMILCDQDPILPDLKRRGERYHVIKSNPTAEAIAKLIYDYAVTQGFPVRKVTLWETESSFAISIYCFRVISVRPDLLESRKRTIFPKSRDNCLPRSPWFRRRTPCLDSAVCRTAKNSRSSIPRNILEKKAPPK